jgi:HK97 family phage major capsid protein
MASLVDSLYAQRDRARRQAEAVLAEAAAANREYLSADENRRFAEHRADLERITAALSAATDDLERRSAIDANPLVAKLRAHQTQDRTTPMRTLDHNLTYRRADQRTSWIRDLILNHANQDPTGECRARLARHAEEVAHSPEFQEHRDLSRVDGEGGYFVPPAWLVDQYAELARPGRAFADLLRRQPLPGGTDSINVPKVLTGTATAIQTADLQPVAEIDLTDTFVNAKVQTIAGQQGVALQLIDQSPIAFDDVVFRDLIAAYAVNVDTQALYGSGVSGQILGVDNWPGVNTVAIATVDIKGLYSALANAINTVQTTRYMPPTAIVMHPRRWAWLTSLLDLQSRPLFQPQATAFNTAGTVTDVAAQGVVGAMLGLPIVVDANISTTLGTGTAAGTQDQIIVLRAEDVVLFESGVRARVLPEPRSNILSVVIQVYGYLALAVRYPGSICTVSGLTQPTF